MMADLDECIHSPVLTPDTCTMCKNLGAEPKAPIVRHKTGAEFTAKYEGLCPACNLPIATGQQVQRWSDGKYRHGGDRPCTP